VIVAQDEVINGKTQRTAADVVREPRSAVNTYLQRMAYFKHPAVQKALAWEKKQRAFEELKASRAGMQ
jgi:cephalosporin hydroxylase